MSVASIEAARGDDRRHGRARDLALALIISRVVRPGSKLSTLTWWDDTTLGADLGVADASTDDIYAAMDWLEHRQDAIEAKLAARPGQPGRPGPTVRGRPAKASYQHDPAGQPYRSFRALLDHLATLTRNQVRYTGTQITIAMLAEPTSIQRQAFELLGTPIPLTLK